MVLGVAAGGSPRARATGPGRVLMLDKPLLSHILDNDALTRGLEEPEARVLVEWLVEQAERFAALLSSERAAQAEVRTLCRRARAIGRFVGLWCHERARGAAVQLAGAERFSWPLPATAIDPCELMQAILEWEANQLRRAEASRHSSSGP
jgi:hypothetical protein